MTEANYNSIPEYQDFKNNFESLQENLNDYEELQKQQTSLQNSYQSQLQNVNWKGKNPWVLLITVMQLILDPGTNMINNQIDQKGTESECQTSLLRCQNDLQRITNNTKAGLGAIGLQTEAHGMDKLIGLLGGSQAVNVFGAVGSANLSSNFLKIRQQIWIGKGEGDQTNNSTTPSDCNFWVQGSGGTTPPSGVMYSFAEMNNGMSEQGNSNAIEANTNLTNSFGTNTSLLQSASAQTKEELTESINVVKTLASAGSSFGHSISQVSSAAEQNMRPQ
jgi:hypothetical protein